MKQLNRIILSMILSCLIILTGQGVAASRGVDRAVGQMVLCTGHGPVVIYMDAEGQPTSAPHFCPDYALALLGAVPEAQPDLPHGPGRAGHETQQRSEGLIAAPVPRRPARAPPAIV
ncbi:hypothetical protein [Ruegeria sp.]|uniref:hypothetical protein n=1 Tax=Ruegeria sp. TaxID=1879320 RepID=UPI00230A2508|nr:hypothetical protein [Ruegeria sp.]MDA7966660.1 hypothetical protein [Ruegeria sp.]